MPDRARHAVFAGILTMALTALLPAAAVARERWTADQANAWTHEHPWLAGSNYNPQTAINELEMWQADTFDPATIDKELGWAEGLGFNSMRVFAHHLPWEQDSKGFLDRMDQFLGIADKHHVGIMFVLFDSCWDPHPKSGKQRDPKPGVHNSGWVQCPGVDDLRNPARQPLLEAYVKGVVGRFKDDKRVVAWDVFNEPDNTNNNSYGKDNLKQEPADKVALSLDLLKRAFAWARDANPSQPLTSAPWQGDWAADKLSDTARFQLDSSDVISFHCYDPLDGMKRRVESLRRYDRPLVCTEYMARPTGSRFDPILGYLKEQKVGAYNWGFVAGRSNTMYAWDTWQKPATGEPKVWFHDVFRGDGTPFDAKEVEYIRRQTGKVAP